VQLVRLVIVIVTTLAVTGSYLQEMRRLSVIERLPGQEARAYYEATRERDERLLIAVTIGLVVLATAAGIYALLAGGTR
jgi:hypothetical protein